LNAYFYVTISFLDDCIVLVIKIKISVVMNRMCNFSKAIFSVCLLAAVVCTPGLTNAQAISTMGGDGKQLVAGDGGFAVYASFSTPTGMAVDKNGDTYIADQKNNRIRKINSYGVISTVAGYGSGGMTGDGGPAGSAKINNPQGIAADRIGNIYFCDASNHRVRRIDTAGIISTIAGNGIGGYSGDDTLAIHAELYMPYGVAVDTNGNVFIADYLNHRIRKVNTAGIITTVAGNGTPGRFGDNGPATDANLNKPNGVAVAADGSIYIADAFNNAIRKVAPDGTITTAAGSENGVAGFGGDNGTAGQSKVSRPTAVAIDKHGNIFFADRLNNRVRKIDGLGIVSTVAGNGAGNSYGDGGSALDAGVVAPTSIAVDAAGNLYIGESNKVRYVYLADPKNEGSITIFPNPCSKHANIFLQSPSGETATIFVLNSSGRVVSQSVGPTNKNIDIRFDAAGAYVIYAVSKSGKWKGKVAATQ
jgi:sugar lactone lactonase YvrE